MPRDTEETRYAEAVKLWRSAPKRLLRMNICSSPFSQNAIHNHIRLFEPLVIKALKQYTTSTSVVLQRQVLDLLAQLVQLRVNYCLLDSDQVKHSLLQLQTLSFPAASHIIHRMFQVFIGFVLKQFEYIEVGQFR